MSIKDYFLPQIINPSPLLSLDIWEDRQRAAQSQCSQAQLAQNLAQNQYTQAQIQAQQYNPEPNIHVKAMSLLKLRLAGLDSKFHMTSDEFLTCHVSAGIVYIFFVIGGKAGHLEEETALFPSDKLITQFRLIR